jgi:hypothetical protein
MNRRDDVVPRNKRMKLTACATRSQVRWRCRREWNDQRARNVEAQSGRVDAHSGSFSFLRNAL